MQVVFPAPDVGELEAPKQKQSLVFYKCRYLTFQLFFSNLTETYSALSPEELHVSTQMSLSESLWINCGLSPPGLLV